VSLESVRLAGTGGDDSVASVVFAGSAADVRDVIVGAEPVVRGGRHLRLDVPAELDRIITSLT
jgi:cytosine/adenosine deaminase-related metal-dependent hydrolase